MGSHVLIVDDEPENLDYLISGLESSQCQVEVARHGLAALQRVQQDPVPDLILLDMVMPGMSGLETLQRLRQYRSNLKIVMVSNVNDTRKAVTAAQLGAADYLTKPLRSVDLAALLRLAPLQQGPETAATPGVERMGDRICVLAGPAMQAAYQQVLQVASLNVPVLLLGESGTGKEVLAQLIHHRSPQAGKPFVKVNCAALPAELLESELFGYEAGAFTGAVKAKPGKFETARGGTIFLDEIGEMPAALQAKLLHVLQDGSFTRLGATRPSSTDARIISATNIDLERALADRNFRSDLFYRLSGFTIELPPLRKRREEIPVLLRHFMNRFAETFVRPTLPFSEELLEVCARYDWPGNLREMENFVKRYLILADEALVVEEMQRRLGAAPAAAVPVAARAAMPETREKDLKSLVRGLKGEVEAEAIAEVLAQAHGVRKEAARMLNISYKSLLHKLRAYGLDQPAS